MTCCLIKHIVRMIFIYYLLRLNVLYYIILYFILYEYKYIQTMIYILLEQNKSIVLSK